jgi:hypothetical protein
MIYLFSFILSILSILFLFCFDSLSDLIFDENSNYAR